MTVQHARFAFFSRLLHWVMAVMILVMLFAGVIMAATVGPNYAAILALHRPVGIAILVLVVLRLINRLISPPPPLPAEMPAIERFAAKASHVLLYAVMFAMPLIGWGMLSAGRYPIVLVGGLELPPILPHDLVLYAALRRAHTIFAFAFYGLFLLHMAAALRHGLIKRDGVFESMASLKPGRD